MVKGKLCIDIGGTKIIFGILSSPNNIIESIRVSTPQSKDVFLKELGSNIKKYLPYSNGIINVSIAGRLNQKGIVAFSPNLPIKGVNLLKFLRNFSKNVNIENDGNCFALYQLYKGYLKKTPNGLIIVWGTGIGSSIISEGKIYKGAGFATESGHLIYDYKNGRSVENVIGGRSIEKIYGINGFYLHKKAENGDKTSIQIFDKIGTVFGYYLSSMLFVLDPKVVVIGGSFANSWKFMKPSVHKILQEKSIRRKINIKIVRGKFYVLRGCYFLDEYENFNN